MDLQELLKKILGLAQTIYDDIALKKDLTRSTFHYAISYYSIRFQGKDLRFVKSIARRAYDPEQNIFRYTLYYHDSLDIFFGYDIDTQLYFAVTENGDELISFTDEQVLTRIRDLLAEYSQARESIPKPEAKE